MLALPVFTGAATILSSWAGGEGLQGAERNQQINLEPENGKNQGWTSDLILPCNILGQRCEEESLIESS